ncbi:MAG: chromosomal replication initiator protein DnaA [Candidatus Andersenbacteria bacterium]|jgi:chromosomal replication initiator protein|nr:chromosomal replication initiator protein DnaA [Candidatus Andersenbacteria bacterium]
MTNEQLWQAVLGELELSISKANFTTWFKSTEIASKNEDEIIVNVPNGFTKEWLENKYHKFILKAIQGIYPTITKVTYKIGKSQNATTENNSYLNKKNETSYNAANKKTYNNIDSFLNPQYTFENFIVGSNNELAYAACLAVSKKLGAAYNPLFIYGGVGLGKTHMLQSIGNEILKKDPSKKVKYASSEKFTNELINAISGKNTKAFKEIYRKIDILIIDDIQFLAGKEKTQEEFFHTFNTLYENNKQIVLSSDRPPKAIPALEERLRSRFEGGMIADVGSPDYETRFAILKAKAREKNFEIPDESLNYIALHIQKNIRELQGALNRVIAICELDNSYPDIKKTTNILANIISQPIKKATTPKDILKIVSDFYDVPVDNLIKKNRRKEIVKPRQIAMYLMRTEIKSSFPSIGNWIGGRDHTTAMHAYEKISREIENDKVVEQEIHLIIERLYN